MSVAAMAVIQFGGYVNPYKVAGILVLLIVWVKLLAWIDKDSVAARLPREIVYSAMMGGLIIGYLMFFFLPGFGLAIGVLVGLFAADLGGYLFMRSRTIGLGDIKDQFSDWWNGLLKTGKKKEVKAVQGEVMIMDASGSAQAPPESDSPDLIRFESAQAFLTKPLRVGAERLDMVAGEPTAVSYMVDGMKYDGDAIDRNRAGAAVQYIKEVARLDMNERRKPQTGTFKAALDGKKYTIQVTTFGSAQGESMRLVTNPKDRQNFKLDALGFSEDQLASIRELVNDG